MITKEIVDEVLEYKDGMLFWKKTLSNVAKSGNRAGGVTPNGYRELCIMKKSYYEHRLIFLLHNGYLPDFIDHIDRNPLNNKIENLRPVTKSQNQHNRVKCKNNTSGYKGVSWNKVSKKWTAQIWINGRKIHLGCFIDILDANEAYKLSAVKIHGEFSNIKLCA